MTQRNLEKGIGFWILSAANLLERTANEELAPYGITYRQVQVLGTLAHVGEISQAELAKRIQVEPSTVVRVVDRMERDGWLERYPSPTDRRVKLLRTTSQVEPVWDTIQEVGRRVRERMTSGLDDSQTEALMKSLAIVCANLGGDA